MRRSRVSAKRPPFHPRYDLNPLSRVPAGEAGRGSLWVATMRSYTPLHVKLKCPMVPGLLFARDDAPNRRFQLTETDRLDQMFGETRLTPSSHILFHSVSA